MSPIDMCRGAERRAKALDEAKNLVCTNRNFTYGDAEDTFNDIAILWQWYLGRNISSQDVAAMMTLFKMARLKHNKQHRDSAIDMIGYAACLAGIQDLMAPVTLGPLSK